MRVGIPKETSPGETRVAVIPAAIPPLLKSGLEVAVESGAGVAAGFPDDTYRSQGATVALASPNFSIVGHRAAGPRDARRSFAASRGQTAIGFADPLGAHRRSATLRHPESPVLDGADAAHHARAEHGRAVVDGHHRRL